MTDTQSIESYINSGGAVADAQKALATGNRVASVAVSAGSSVAGGLATGTGLFATGGSVATALTSAGVASSTVPVIGWIVAGVLVASAGGITVASRRRAQFLSKDRNLLEKYIKNYEGKSLEWRTREAKKQISQIQFLLTKRDSNYNRKRKAKAELKLEALYYIAKNERLPLAVQKAQMSQLQTISDSQRTQRLIFIPVIGLAVLGSFLLWRNKSNKRSP